MNLVLVAGGLGSRLAPLTNYIPKFLVNIGKNTGYVEMIRYWKQYSDFDEPEIGSLTVIVNEEYANLVRAYHEMYFPTIPLIVKTVTVANGSAHAILSTCSHLDGKAVTFAWCDVIPGESIPFDEFGPMYCGANVVFTNYNNSNRYELVREGHGHADMIPAVSKTERGGCFGLYHINHFHTGIEYEDGQDFIEVIRQYGKIREHRLQNIIDFGDMPKLIRTRSHADEAREFNSVEFIDQYVLKAAMNEQGRKIIAKEIDWYNELGNLLGPNGMRPPVPEAWLSPSKDSFFMKRVPGVPIWRAWPELSPVDRRHVLQQVIDGEDMLFKLCKISISQTTLLRDVYIEANKKLYDRYNEIRAMVDAFGEVRLVNGYELSSRDPIDTINRLSLAIETYYRSHPNTEYGFIHGDLQFSNSMVDLDTLKVTIIDPRGYFGQSSLIGLQDYDIGKLLYALSGYDTFNYSKTFGIRRLGNKEIWFDIPTLDLDGVGEICRDHFKTIHRLWLAVCWIGLAQYIKNDPVKSVCAHYHGLVLAERALRAD